MWWDDFLRVVVGLSRAEIHSRIRENFTEPTLNSVGRDTPPKPGENVTDSWALFMAVKFTDFPIKDLSPDALYGLTMRMKESHEKVCPPGKDIWANEWAYYGPAYRAIEKAYGSGNVRALHQGVSDLIDKAIHF